MSDEEDEFHEPFSLSEDEWSPGEEKRNGESSDDDDSDFEEIPKGRTSRNGKTVGNNILKKNTKISDVSKQNLSKKRKSVGQSLGAKLYNKYRPPPRTIQSPISGNSPSASTSKAQPKNYQTPNDDNDNSDTDGSVANYLVNPNDIDLRSSFFRKVRVAETETTDVVPNFDCNAGIQVMSESDSEDNESSNEDVQKKPQQQQEQKNNTNNNNKAYNFLNLLESANNLERIKEEIAKKYVNKKQSYANQTTNAIDVNALLALGENIEGVEKNVENCDENVSRLIKTKSTRVKKHTKTRPTSTVGAGDTDDSDWEEVAGRKRF